MFGFRNKSIEKGEEPAEQKTGFFSRLKQGLKKTREGFTGRLDRLFLGKKEIDAELLDELEEILFTSDLGVEASKELIELIREGVERKNLDNPAQLKAALKEKIIEFLTIVEPEVREPKPGEPLVVMMIGVNGVGKTTTIGKVAALYKNEGKKVMLAAGDTFRAAAAEQLAIWGERVGADVIRQNEGADPSAVVYDAVSAAVGRQIDVLLIDTAGRLHTKVNLMEELSKIYRVADKKLPGAPHQIWLVLDATTGQNAISQAEIFHKILGLNGLILTKLDGTAKGGIVVGISRQLGIPIKYIGVGEKLDDLRPFNAKDFAEAIFSE
ncbi:MAG: signal recognition particle-docking protein FtsY [Deltaproteobacteria bacterium]|nr:signal recognition particle-docking protein FtsY [Deltaproteobacteria bacterium]